MTAPLSTTVSAATLILLLLLCTAITAVTAMNSVAERTVKVDLTLTYGIVAPDGYRRPGILINGQFPGPTIRVHQNDLLVLTVHNRLFYEGVSVHIHGLHQRGTPQYDGVAYGTQWPILPGKSFTHRMKVTNGPGTYWYHAHYQLQSQSVFGAFVIDEDDSNSGGRAYRYDSEQVVMLSDWFHATDLEQLIGIMTPVPNFKWVGDPQSLLVNGKGRVNCSLAAVPTNCNSSTAAYASLTVKQNHTIRLRIIGATSLSYMSFSIQQHRMTIIEADGYFTEPLTVDTLEINSGQRYSVLIRTDQPPGSYRMDVGVRWRKSGPTGIGFLHYASAARGPVVNPELTVNDTSVPLFPPFMAWNPPLVPDGVLASLKPVRKFVTPLPKRVSKQILLVGQQKHVKDAHNVTRVKWAVNDVAFEAHEEEPLLLTAARAPNNLQLSLSDNVKPLVFRIDYGDVVELILQNTVALNGICEQHPWHLHGHHFYDLGGGPGSYADHVNAGTLRSYLNTDAPIMRDTVTLYPYSGAYFQQPSATNNVTALLPGTACGFRVLRFIADNPGVWNFHCHIGSHMHMGMQVFFAEALDRLPYLGDDDAVEELGLGNDFGLLSDTEAPQVPSEAPQFDPAFKASRWPLLFFILFAAYSF